MRQIRPRRSILLMLNPHEGHVMTLQPNALKWFVAGAVLALASLAVTTAQAAPMGGGPGGHHGGPGGYGAMMGGPHMDRMLDRINATTEQRAQIKQITAAAQVDMKAQHESGRALREQFMALFAQPTVDARAAEELRQKQMLQRDAASKRMLQMMLDVSQVLSPDQRKQIADSMAERRNMMQRHQRERQSIDTPKAGG
jgi:protein CpxP